MKAIAKFLTVITVLVLLAGAYVVRASQLKILPASGLVESAADRAQAFESIIASARVGSDELAVYSDGLPLNPEQYVFVTYTVKLRNLNALPAEWMELSLSPQPEDILLVKATVKDVPAFSEQLVTIVLLTDRATASYARSAELTYYVYGHEITLPVRLTV